MTKDFRIECTNGCLINASCLSVNGSGILSWVINLNERWVGFERQSGVNKTGESYIEYIFDNGCGLVDSIMLFNLNKSRYHLLGEMEKDQMVTYLVPVSQLMGGKEVVPNMTLCNKKLES